MGVTCPWGMAVVRPLCVTKVIVLRHPVTGEQKFHGKHQRPWRRRRQGQ